MDLDFSRAELLTRLFAHGLRRTRGALVLAGVDISFRREIRPLQAYDTRSCVLAWDRKWIYVLSYHVKPGAVVEELEGDWVAALFGQDGLAQSVPGLVYTVAVSKYVAKAGRRTIQPVDLLEAGGLLKSGCAEPTGKQQVDVMHERCKRGLELLKSRLNE